MPGRASKFILSGIFIVGLLPAILAIVPAGMLLGQPKPGWEHYMLFALVGLLGPISLFVGLLNAWPWPSEEREQSIRLSWLAGGVALCSYGAAWALMLAEQ